MTFTSKKIVSFSLIACAAVLAACGGETPVATTEPVVVEAPMEEVVTEITMPTIVELAVGSSDLTTLVAAVQAAGLVDTLNSEGPFTVFAPTNAAFAKLPAGTVETLVMPESKDMLTAILTYHVVAGEVMAADLIGAIESNGGSFSVATVNGGMLTAAIVDGSVVLTDATGGKATVVATDLNASNGVVHLLDTVVLPN